MVEMLYVVLFVSQLHMDLGWRFRILDQGFEQWPQPFETSRADL